MEIVVGVGGRTVHIGEQTGDFASFAERRNRSPILASEKRERDLNLGFEIRLLDYRNLRWIPKIDGLIRSGVPTSIVVGTGHFCGTNSVIDLLQKKGYKFEQL